MYTIFIFIAVGFISPLLFGLSTVLTDIMSSTLGSVGEIPTEVSANVPISVAKVMISVSFVRWFSVGLLIISAILSSLVLGLINSGEEKDGLRYIPILIALSLVMYFLTGFGVKLILSTFVSA
jgi:archaellum biogenesis protein FlaJ (TadC family)